MIMGELLSGRQVRVVVRHDEDAQCVRPKVLLDLSKRKVSVRVEGVVWK